MVVKAWYVRQAYNSWDWHLCAQDGGAITTDFHGPQLGNIGVACGSSQAFLMFTKILHQGLISDLHTGFEAVEALGNNRESKELTD